MTDVYTLAGEFRLHDTPSVSDALDTLGLPGGLLGIKPVLAGKRICGPAFTVRYIPCGPVKNTVGDFLDDVKAGQVIAIDNAGRVDCTIWGDLMSITAKRNSVEATVIDGACRDIPVIVKEQYPVFSRGTFMMTGKDRVQLEAVNAPITLAGVQVCPDDLLLGDDSGVIVIPAVRAEEVLRVTIEIAEKEREIENAIRSGKTLREARKASGYHALQTRRNS